MPTAIGAEGRELATESQSCMASKPFDELSQRAHVLCSALQDLAASIPEHTRSGIAAIAVAGTTTTSLLVDRNTGDILADPILYNEPQSPELVALAQVRFHLDSSKMSNWHLCQQHLRLLMPASASGVH